MQFPRIPWQRNHMCEQPSRLVFVDTETVTIPKQANEEYERLALSYGVAHSWTFGRAGWRIKDRLQFIHKETFWDWLYKFGRKTKPTLIYAHNMPFDFTILDGWGQLDSGNLRISEVNNLRRISNGVENFRVSKWNGCTAIDGEPFILECRSDYGKMEFLDTGNYWKCKLSELGKSFGLKKLEYRDFFESPANAWEYCERDVSIIETAIISLMRYWKENDLGNWQPTIAGLAYSAFRHGKESHTLTPHGDQEWTDETKSGIKACLGYDPIDPKEATEIEFRSYYGGKTTCYFVGDIVSGSAHESPKYGDLYNNGRYQIPGPIHVLDCNSLYPYAMQAYCHPVELMFAYKGVKIEDARNMASEFFCIADVRLKDSTGQFPVHRGVRSLYPSGNFSTTLCGLELRNAFEGNNISGISNILAYYSGAPFTNFVRDWHNRRVEYANNKDDIKASFCKLFMNNLYGKLAQRSPQWEIQAGIVPPVRWGGYIGQSKESSAGQIMRAVAGIAQAKMPRKSCRHTFAPAAASVTSCARDYMASVIKKLPFQSVVYSDTDSVFVNDAGLEAMNLNGLIHKSDLGKFKHVGTYKICRIFGPKNYELDDKRVIAGLKADAEEISERCWQQVNYEGIKQIIQHEPTGEILRTTQVFRPNEMLFDRAIGFGGWTAPLDAGQTA